MWFIRKINKRRSSPDRQGDGKMTESERRRRERKSSLQDERPFYLPFTLHGLPYSCQVLPVPLCRILAVCTGSGLFVSFLLPVGVKHSEERNVCGNWEGGTTHTVFASNQEGAPGGDLWTSTAECSRAVLQTERGGGGLIWQTYRWDHIGYSVYRHFMWAHMQNIKPHLIQHLILSD